MELVNNNQNGSEILCFKSDKIQLIVNNCVKENAIYHNNTRPDYGKRIGTTWESCFKIIRDICSNSMKVICAIVFKCLFPIIDTLVTKDIRHLLKSPFSVHDITKNICVPLDISTISEFNVSNALNINHITSDPARCTYEFQNIYLPQLKKHYNNNNNNVTLPFNIVPSPYMLCYYCIVKHCEKCENVTFELLKKQKILYGLNEWLNHITENHKTWTTKKKLFAVANQCILKNFAMKLSINHHTDTIDFNLMHKLIEHALSS